MSSRLKWLCRRGMKELDLLMDGYLEEEYAQASAEDQRAFVTLLEYQDHCCSICCLPAVKIPIRRCSRWWSACASVRRTRDCLPAKRMNLGQ